MDNQYIIELIQSQPVHITVIAEDEFHAYELALNCTGDLGQPAPIHLEIKTIRKLER